MRSPIARRAPGPMLWGMKSLLMLTLILSSSCAMTTAGTPGGLRQSVLRDTATAPEGSLGAEMGVTIDPGDRRAVPVRFEYGYRDDITLFVDVAAYEKISQPGSDGEGFGDLGVGWRNRFFESQAGTEAAFEGRVTFPTGDESEGTGTGSLDLYAAGILTQSFDDVLLGGWLEVGLLGDAFDSGTDMQRTVGLSVVSNLSETLMGFGVLERTFGDHSDPAVGRAGVAWRMAVDRTIDIGLSSGLNNDAPDGPAFFIGFSSNLGVLGPRRAYAMPEYGEGTSD